VPDDSQPLTPSRLAFLAGFGIVACDGTHRHQHNRGALQVTLNDEFAFSALRRRIDDPHNRAVLVVIENADGTLDTAYMGAEGEPGMFALAFSLAAQLSDEIMAGMPGDRRPIIMLPTLEQAHDMGIVKSFRRRQ
jgi:hypothetical protein